MSPDRKNFPCVAVGQQRHYEAFGFVRLPRALEADRFADLWRDYDRVMHSPHLRLPFSELGRAPAFTASCMSDVSPYVVELATSDCALDFATALLGAPAICVQASAYQRAEDTRWHCDNLRLDYRGLKFYLNLDAVDANSGALRLIPGSHLEPLHSALLPPRYTLTEQLFEVLAEQVPSVSLDSSPGDVSVFDLRAWHAVCCSGPRRRTIELTYYAVPEVALGSADFVAQMRANQQHAHLSGTLYYSRLWRQAGGRSHQRGMELLAQLGLLDVGAT